MYAMDLDLIVFFCIVRSVVTFHGLGIIISLNITKKAPYKSKVIISRYIYIYILYS